jgi:hypothetical protein
MQMTHVALTLTIGLLGVTGYLAWEGQQAAKGAREELKFVKERQAAEETAHPSSERSVALPSSATASVSPPVIPTTPTETPPPTPLPAPNKAPAQEELMAGSGALPGGGLTIPKSVAAAEAAGVNTNTLTAAQKQVLAAKPIAKVTRVVSDQGFVVIDAGSKQGITKGMKLAIRRDSAILGKVAVTDSIDENESVADMDIASVPTGVTIEPGDEIIEAPAK